MVFKNLGIDKALELYDQFIAKGLSGDDAFTEVYSIECNMDNEDENESIGQFNKKEGEE